MLAWMWVEAEELDMSMYFGDKWPEPWDCLDVGRGERKGRAKEAPRFSA